MEKIYRIISFPTFINLIENQEERFVNPTSWADTYEGYMLRMLESPENRKEVIQVLYDIVSPGDIEKVIANYMKLWAARWLCYGQCWSKTEESDALWRIYSYEKMAIRIETTVEEINSIFNNSELFETYKIEIDDVKYDLDKENTLQGQAEILKQCKKTVDPFFHKRKAFEHENEKRVILFHSARAAVAGFASKGAHANFYRNNEKLFDNLDGLDSKVLLPKIEEEIDKMSNWPMEEKTRKELFIKIPDISQYIKSVMIHPKAEPWIVRLVEQICSRVGIKCIGKSHMYDNLV